MKSVSKYYIPTIHWYGNKLKNNLNKLDEYIYPEALASIYRKVYLYVHVL